MYLISACLCGVNCKYNGANNYNEICDKLFSSGKAILVCPEQLGGLPTPRIPSEIINYSKENSQKDITIINKNGDNVSKEFIKGAQEVLNIAKKLNINWMVKWKDETCFFFAKGYYFYAIGCRNN